jgi:hypothetical protein
MKILVDRLMKETGLSSETAEKVVRIVVDYVEQELPLSQRTTLDLELAEVDQDSLEKDRQPFIIP